MACNEVKCRFEVGNRLKLFSPRILLNRPIYHTNLTASHPPCQEIWWTRAATTTKLNFKKKINFFFMIRGFQISFPSKSLLIL